MSVRLLLAGALLVSLVALFEDVGAQCSCQCKIRRNCPNIAGDPVDHFDLMPQEFQRKIKGNRGNKNPQRYCQYNCLNLLKSYLCTPYDSSVKDRPDGVILDTGDLIGHQRICHGVPESDVNCVFSLEYGYCGANVRSVAIGTTGCLVLDSDGGGTGFLNYFADELNTGTTVSYLSNLDLTAIDTITDTITQGT